jgi:quercetin dioxygenase-like cupin family protein
MFYVLAGSVDMIEGERAPTATKGGLVVVPPGRAHAFAASSGLDGALLVVIAPGIERSDFFRQLVRTTPRQYDT